MIIGFKKSYSINVLIILAVAVLLACIMIVVCTSLAGGNECVGLCPAQSISQSLGSGDLIEFNIPPNAGITKIYASFLQPETDIIFGGHIMILSSVLEYDHFFSKSPLEQIGSFDTTFVQPLCIGEEGATLFFTPVPRVDASLSITVVYCPDFCTAD